MGNGIFVVYKKNEAKDSEYKNRRLSKADGGYRMSVRPHLPTKNISS